MEKKTNRALTRRRPPHGNLKSGSPCIRTERTQVLEAVQGSVGKENDVSYFVQQNFASVHRPRNASISTVRRDVKQQPQQQLLQQQQPQQQQQKQVQQKYLVLPHSTFQQNQQNTSSHEFMHNIKELADNGNSNRIRIYENRKCQWEAPYNQSISGPIPQQFREFHQQPHNKQLNQHNMSNLSNPPTQSTIPQPNFNQISKTATNLLSEIYEKHLLNQTTFENVTMLSKRTTKCIPIGNKVGIAQPSSPQSVDFIEPAKSRGISENFDKTNFDLNNFQEKQQFIRNRNQQITLQQIPYRTYYQQQQQQQQEQHQQQQLQHALVNQTNHQTSLQSTQNHKVGQVLEELQDLSQHVYETVNRPTSSVTPCMVASAMITPNRIQRKRTAGKNQRISKNSTIESKQSNSSSQKKYMSSNIGERENYFGMNACIVQQTSTNQNQYQQQQQQQQKCQHQQQQQQHYQPPSPPPYNRQPRTKADGENDSSIAGYCSKTGGKSTMNHSLQNSTQSVQARLAVERTLANATNNECHGMQNIRGTPIGSAGVDGCRDGCRDGCDPESSERTEYNPELNGAAHTPSGIAKFQYRNSKIDLMLETAQAMAAAAYYAKAAQKIAQSGSSRSKSTDMSSRNGGYCGALQRAPPPMPPGIVRRLANKENYGIGKVKVMLRVSDSCTDEANSHFMFVDKKKRQVTLTDPATSSVVAASTSQERGPMVAAPKLFAFDGLFTAEDQQSDVCSSALSEVIPAVLEGSDGCLLTIGYPTSGQSKTMLGAVNPPSELGAIPCAISWLYKGINERRQKSGSRFSVRVSALGVSATKPDSSSKDLLAAHATDSDDSPGVYLRDDFLGGPTELRAPTAERAALFLDAALAGRPQSGLEPAMIFTLHVYQYSLSRKGGVAGGRSRLHLIDLGGCANRNGGLPLSGIGNVLLAILSGQRHPPNKDHPLTPLLKDCLAPLTCHVTIMAHVTHAQSHADALTTIQLASRIHRMRRRKHRFQINDKALGVNNPGHQSGGSSEGPDPSSSDLSADTVIYMGPCDDATDGEHPPVYLPSLCSGDNRCAMNKVLKGSGAEKPSKIPGKNAPVKSQSPVPHRTDSIKRVNVPSSSPTLPSSELPTQSYSPIHNSPKMVPSNSSPKIVAGALRHNGISKGSNVPTPKSSPLRRPNIQNPESPMRQISEEQWIDGPRVSRAKVAEARHLLREINHVKQCETWVDGPKSVASSPAKPLTVGNLPTGTQTTAGYGFMDSHKKTMIRQWVENQSSHVFQSPVGSPTHQTHQQQVPQQHQQPQQSQEQQQQQIQHQLRNTTYHLTQFKQMSEEDQHSVARNSEMLNPIGANPSNSIDQSNHITEISLRSVMKLQQKDETDRVSEQSELSVSIPLYQDTISNKEEDQEDQDSGPSEVPPALPLIEPLGSREISHESLHRIISRHVSRESLFINQHHVQTMDCGLQVTEEEIARTMGCEHPLAALSHGDISVVSSFNIGDAFSDCAIGERTRNQFDQLARLREIFTSQLAMAEVTPTFRIGEAGSVYSEPAFRFNPGPGSVCSEPAYRPPSPRCRGCRQSLNASRTPSQTSLPSLNGIMTIAGMEQYASLRHPDGASDPNLEKAEKSAAEDEEETNEKSALLMKGSSTDPEERNNILTELPVVVSQTQLPLLPLSTPEAYDSGHDSSTPRASKHSGISRRAESGYHSVATARDSDESSFTSAISKEHNRITMKKKRHDKSLCNWLRNPFTCTYPETEGEISDF